ncbi:hypothetical protein CXB51_016603 [Gossypium anomalum]|uniref:Retrotransposon gag protein n=1 Tax=Gossypium anomalum TaxID=47600 RepID=A0A8J5YMI2_9ROSI|nr:hypothetical protein CXB51_016603 [Gossypium anomalum]
MDLETLYDAWERFKELLRRCPHHGLPLWLQVQTFYNGVNPSTRQMIDAAAGGTINNKTLEEAFEFIEEMSLNNYQWQVMRTKPMKIAGIYNVDSVAMLKNQLELLNKKIDGLLGSTQVHPVMRCDSSGGGVHTEYPPFNPTTEEEQVNYMGNKILGPRITPIVTLTMQVGRTTQISLGVVKEIKGHRILRVSNNHLINRKRSRTLRRCYPNSS